jgi:hypothetical protein
MALPVLDGNGLGKSIKTTLDGSDLVPHHNVDKLPGTVETDISNTAAHLATIITSLTAIDGHVDGLEGFTDGIEAALTALQGYVDGLETLTGTTNTSLTALQGYVDGLETLVTATNSALTALQGYVDQLEGYTDGVESKLDSVIANQAPPSAIYGGKKTIATAGSSAQIQTSSQALTEGVWVRGLDANTGVAYVGSSSVSATAGGTRVAAKEAVFVRIDNLNKVYVDVAVSGEGVTFLGW